MSRDEEIGRNLPPSIRNDDGMGTTTEQSQTVIQIERAQRDDLRAQSTYQVTAVGQLSDISQRGGEREKSTHTCPSSFRKADI